MVVLPPVATPKSPSSAKALSGEGPSSSHRGFATPPPPQQHRSSSPGQRPLSASVSEIRPPPPAKKVRPSMESGPVVCDLCRKVYKNRSTLYSHKNRDHGLKASQQKQQQMQQQQPQV